MSRGRGRGIIHVNSYISKYVKKELQWYERDGIMTYIDQLKYEEYSRDPHSYVANANLINFNMIHARCRGDKQENSTCFYQTIKASDLTNMPEKEKDTAVSACLRSPRPDVCLEKVNFRSFLE